MTLRAVEDKETVLLSPVSMGYRVGWKNQGNYLEDFIQGAREDGICPGDINDHRNIASVWEPLAAKRKLMGFGHAVYRTMDPRARVLKALSRDLAARRGDAVLHETAEAVEAAALDQKGLNPNVDFYAATVYHMLGIPTDLMTPIFALARMAGWTAHVREQYVDNRIIRPGSVYVGPTDRSWSPIASR